MRLYAKKNITQYTAAYFKHFITTNDCLLFLLQVMNMMVMVAGDRGDDSGA